MAKNLQFQIKYTGGGYLDSNIAISSISELKEKFDFIGQSVHMPEAFMSTNDVPYPVDFWMTPNGEDVKWELKNIPTFESAEDFERFKVFCGNFKSELGYYPMANGSKIIAEGEEFEFQINENGDINWISTQELFDETITDAVKLAVEEVTSGASEAFDTLKEIEDWIKANSGNTGGSGVDGVTPKFKIEDNYWFVSYDEGESWEQLGKATGEQGPEGPQGVSGKSAYQIWVAKPENSGKTVDDFFESLKGEKGALDEEQIANVIDSATSYTDQKISELEIPSIEGLATSGDVENVKTWVENQDYLKEHQDISHLAVSADVVSAIEEIRDSIPSTEGLATSGDVKNAIDLHITMYHTPVESGGTVNPSGGTINPIPIPTLKYTEGSGITIDDETKTISVKVAKDTKEKENFIEFNEDNELVLNKITLDATVISEDIEINGGAWADEVETVFDGKIPSGITFEEFLKKMLKKEYFVSDFSTVRNFEVSLTNNNPTLTSNGVDVIGQVVEIGTMVKLGAISAPETKAVQTLSAGSFTYGYKVGEDGEYKNSKLYTEILTPNLVESESKIHVTFSNLVNDINGNTELEGIFVSGGNSVNEVIGYVREGHNNIRISQTGNTYSSNSDVKGSSIFVASSLKNYTNSNGETNIYEITFPSSAKTAMSQVDYQVIGAKKYYIGGINEYSKDYWAKTKGNRSDVIRNLELQGWASDTSIEVSYEFKKGTKQQTVAIPVEYTKVNATDRLGGPVSFNLVAENIDFYNQQGYVCKYNVYVAPAYDGLSTNSFINITIEK